MVTRRAICWAIVLAVADVVVFGFTWHDHETYHHTVNTPTVMPVGQLFGWAGSVALLIAVVLVLLAGRQAARYRRHWD